MARKGIVGGAVITTLSSAINSSVETITIGDATGWADGSGSKPFEISIHTAEGGNQETILCSSRTGTTITVSSSQRGYDDTTAVSHAQGETVEMVVSATTIDEANKHVNDITNDEHTQYLNNTRHDVTARHGFGAALGTPGTPTSVGTSASAGSGTVPARSDHTHDLAAGSIDAANLFTAGVIDAAAIGNDQLDSQHYTDGSIDGEHIADSQIDSGHYVDGSIDTEHVADSQITKPKIEDAQQIPSGVIWDYGAASPPTGWLACDGSAVSRTTYADLFAIVGTTWGVGDGSTTFNLPNFENLVTVGAGDTYSLADTGGEATHTLVTGEIPSHTHGSAGGHTHSHGSGTYVINTGSAEAQRIPDAGSTSNGVYVSYSGSTSNNGAHTHSNVGSDGAHNNLQPYAAVTKIIKT